MECLCIRYSYMFHFLYFPFFYFCRPRRTCGYVDSLYIYITMLLPILIVIKFIINTIFILLKFNYHYHIISMFLLLSFLCYLSTTNDDHLYRFFNISNSYSYFYKSIVFNIFLLILYYKKWTNFNNSNRV